MSEHEDLLDEEINECGCGCGHDHHEETEQEHEDTHGHHHNEADDDDDVECSCGHDHHHHHHHDSDDNDDECDCGHDHHHHDDDDECDCGHDHHHHHHDDDDDDDECGCGHDHHHHHHDDDDNDDDECGCGHDHHHHHHDDDDDDDDECGCGHDHHHHHHDDDDDDDDECGCGHDHHHHHHDGDDDDDDECGCGHDHHHHHHDDDECGCGHDHHHHHHDDDDDDECGCGHDHHHEHAHHHESAAGSVTRTYIVENLDCANCAAKMERKINGLDGVDEATLTFATKQLRVTGTNPDALLPKMQEICASVDSGVKLVPRAKPAKGSVTRVYLVENLDCANCAAKMERKINGLDGVAEATLTFATKQLRVTGTNPDALLPKMQEICASVDSEVKLVPRAKPAKGSVTRVYLVENLDCANCAAKMERKINGLDGVDEATLTFATKQLRVTGTNPDALLPKMQEICASVDSEVKLVPRDPSPARTAATGTAAAAETGTAAASESHGKSDEDRKELLMIISGAVLFVLSEVLEHLGVGTAVTLPVNIVAYLILGLQVVITAVKNLFNGQVFDENFLMSIATLGAFAIGEYPEAVGVMLFYRIGEFFEHIAVEKSRTQIMDAVDMRPETVNLVAGDDLIVIPAEDAEVGSVLLVRPGDRIPLDGTVLEGDSRIDTSPITGEPVPVSVKPGDEITSGCVNVSGQLKIRVDKPLEESMVTRILDSVENAAASKPKIDRFITRFARVYTPFVVVLALCTAILPSLVSGNWFYWVHTSLTFLVISCPCALVLSVPLAFFSGIGAGSKQGILFKGGISLEQLHNVKAVIMDKTGTVTEGNFVVQEVLPAADLGADELLQLAAGCEQISTHPIACSIVTAAKEKGLSLTKPEKLEEIAGHGISAETNKGVLLVGNRKLMDQNRIDLSGYQPKGFGSEVLLALNGKFVGYIVISDTIKADAKSAIAAMKKLGVTTAMLTGDAQSSAEAVARETGIDEVHAKLLPQDKLTELKKIRSKYNSVMFVGDGINDAPVLAGADVGAAMGSGADAAIEAADVVFMNSNMEAIPAAIRIANATSSISWQNVVFALVIKALVMILGLAGHASMWFAVFADTGVAMLCVLNSIRILYKK